MIIAPDTKTLEWSIWVLVFFTMAVENVLVATPWCLTNTPLGDGGYGEGHVVRITSWSLAFKPLSEWALVPVWQLHHHHHHHSRPGRQRVGKHTPQLPIRHCRTMSFYHYYFISFTTCYYLYSLLTCVTAYFTNLGNIHFRSNNTTMSVRIHNTARY